MTPQMEEELKTFLRLSQEWIDHPELSSTPEIINSRLNLPDIPLDDLLRSLMENAGLE